MKMGFILFDDMTTLDFAGFHNALTWLRRLNITDNLTWDFCAMKDEIRDDRGMRIRADRVQPNLSGYDLVFIPGGTATRQLIHDENFVGWIRTAEPVKYKVSVCTGALLWGAAGLIKDRVITTNPLALELLEPYCKEVVKARAMRDGDVFTGGGITASVDLGLYFIESVMGKETAGQIANYLDYPYYQAERKDSEPAI